MGSKHRKNKKLKSKKEDKKKQNESLDETKVMKAVDILDSKSKNYKDTGRTKKFKKVKTLDKKRSKAEKKAEKKEKRKDKKKNKRFRKLKLFIKIILVLIIFLIIAAAAVFFGIFFSDKWAITADDLMIGNITTTIYDKDGVEIASVSGSEKRRVISIEEMPKDLQEAFISIEDERFRSHKGVDLKRTLAATATFVTHKGSSSYGGSTITQQLIKNLLNDKDDSGSAGVQRKIREMSRAYQVENLLSKDQILELYLNVIFMGGDVYGVELGSQYYFAKSAKDLDLAECAFLAGINHSPNAYNPYTGDEVGDKIKTRTKVVLRKMLDLGKIDQARFDEAVAKVDAGFEFKKGETTNASTMSYLARAALNQVIQQYAEEKEIDYEIAKSKIQGGGYKIYTTQDSNLQGIVENVFRNSDYADVPGRKTDENGDKINGHVQSAMVIIDQYTGKVVAEVGGLGTDVDSNGINRGTQITRQPGSSIKPIADIAPGLENGIITAATVYDDAPSSFGSYKPHNDSNAYYGLTTMRKVLMKSMNIEEIKVMAEMTPIKSIEFLRSAGVTSLVTGAENPERNDENLSLAIGGITNGISPLEMAGAYAAIANGGTYKTPIFYTEVKDSKGNTILEPRQVSNRILSEANAYICQSMMTGPVSDGGTAPYCKISGMATGGKTGTTDTNYDRWFCGFTPYYTGATWFGYDNQEYVNVSSNPAARLWDAVMTEIHSGLENKPDFVKPDNITSARICLDSGKVASASCSNTYTEVFVQGTVPTTCTGHEHLRICKDSGKIAGEYCPAESVEDVTVKARPEKETLGLWYTTPSTKTYNKEEKCDIHKVKQVSVPNVVGQSLDKASSALKALGLTVEVSPSGAKSGTVSAQSVTAGTKVNVGSKVTLTIKSESGGGGNHGGGNKPNTNTTGGNTTTNETTGGGDKPPVENQVTTSGGDITITKPGG